MGEHGILADMYMHISRSQLSVVSNRFNYSVISYRQSCATSRPHTSYSGLIIMDGEYYVYIGIGLEGGGGRLPLPCEFLEGSCVAGGFSLGQEWRTTSVKLRLFAPPT